jgi:hypothetical protein
MRIADSGDLQRSGERIAVELRVVAGARHGTDVNELAYRMARRCNPCVTPAHNAKRPASLQAAWILAPRPGLEPGTCGLTVYRPNPMNHVLSGILPRNWVRFGGREPNIAAVRIKFAEHREQRQ